MDDRQRIAGLVHVEPRQRAPRPANKIERQPLTPIGPTSLVERTRDLLVVRALPFRAERGEAEHAQREGDALLQLAVADADQFEAATAQIADDPVRVGEGGEDAGAGGERFLLARQRLDRQPGGGGVRDQLRAVGGVANGGGGDRPQPRDVHLARQPGEAGERRLGDRHCLGADRAGLGEATAEAGEHLFIEQHGGQPLGALIDDEADRVGADVDDRGARVGVKATERAGDGGEEVHISVSPPRTRGPISRAVPT